MRWKYPLALFFGSLTLATTLPLVSFNGCGPLAWANYGSGYGTYYGSDSGGGRSGQDGQNGGSGLNGSHQTITVTGSPVTLNLSGSEGGYGGNGENAQPPNCYLQTSQPSNDLYAANGGSGGRGGNGGQGGNGGNLFVYYSDIAHLRQLAVNASGGRGGRGGNGGWGAQGCQCAIASWQVQTCTNGTCQTNTYRCHAGQAGTNGNPGYDGGAGSPGQLMLANQTTPIPAEAPNLTLAMSGFEDSIVLSRNLWDSRTGAGALLAPGSSIADTYYHYTGHIETEVRLDWQSDQLQRAIFDPVNLSLQYDGQVQANFSDNLWVNADLNQEGSVATLVVRGLVRAEDATRMALGQVSGRSRDFVVNVVDLGQKSDIVQTQFFVKYQTSNDSDRNSRYRTQYEGEISSDLVSQDFNRFSLALGRLPIPGQTLSGGTQAKIELTIVRSYAGHSASQTLEWQGEI
jgi:hypothetical protein